LIAASLLSLPVFRKSAFESGFGTIFAIDPVSGRELWRHDAKVNPNGGYGDFASRGVSTWLDAKALANAQCRRRILAATVDARLIALDSRSGALCTGFGSGGTLDLSKGLLPPERINRVYAPGTRQNRPGKPGLYRFYLAHTWSTRLFPDGSYRLEVEASDLYGNRGMLALPFTLVNDL